MHLSVVEVVQHLLSNTRLYLLAASCLLVLAFLVRTVRYTIKIRQRYTDIPSSPRHPAWGHIVEIGKKMAGEEHPDYAFEEVWNTLGRPPGFLFDLAPIDKSMLIVADPQLADAVVNPNSHYKYSTPKSDTVLHLSRLVGLESLIIREGEEWRSLRKRFNPGFQPKYLLSLTPSIVAKTKIFVSRLEQAADDCRTFTLGAYARDLTTDIITELTMERDLQAQSTDEGKGEKGLFGILTASRRLSELGYKAGQGLGLHVIDPIRPIKSMFYEFVYDKRLSTIIQQQIQSLENGQEKSSTKTSIVKLGIANMTPSKALIRDTVHQIKAFLFAGQDTTATLVQWFCYELQKHPKILSRLREEHNSVFGPGAFSAGEILSGAGEADLILNSKLRYTNAVIKETLRCHPPAATARRVPEGTEFDIDIGGKPTRIDGLRIYNCQWLIHRNPTVWGPDAHSFKPERWLDEDYVAKLPPGAYRPFERGPRNCIGQELAMIEGKVVLAMVARGYDFEKVGLTGRDGEKELFNKFSTTSIPVDGMRMKVKKAGRDLPS